LKDPFALCLSLFHEGWLAELCGDGARAGRCGEEGLRVAREFSLFFFELLSYENLGMAKILTQRPDSASYSEGVDLLRKSIDGYRGIGAGMHLTCMLAFLAEALCRNRSADKPLPIGSTTRRKPRQKE